ncbi:MAG: hypothetical protein ACE5JD_18260 [Candidatus Methylomirabilia bacterium]
MPLVRTGRDWLAERIVSTGVGTGVDKPYGSTGAILWVGTGSGAHAPTDNVILGTTISGSTMESGYPIIRSCNVLEFRILKSTDDAVWSWRNWGISNATVTSTASGRLLNRAVEDLGDKSSAQSWQLTASITITTAWLVSLGYVAEAALRLLTMAQMAV